MSGHSKWSTIKRQKQVNDIKKGKVYGAGIKLIESAISAGGTDVENNSALKEAIDNAKRCSIPKTLINRAIERAIERKRLGKEFKTFTYEIITPKPYSGAFILEAATDNPNGFFAQLRKFINKRAYMLSEKEGVIKWMFKYCGVIILKRELCNENIVEKSFEYAEDILEKEDEYIIFTEGDKYHKALQLFTDLDIDQSAIENELLYIPTDPIEADDEYMSNIVTTIEALEDMEEVTKVHNNFKELNKRFLALD